MPCFALETARYTRDIMSRRGLAPAACRGDALRQRSLTPKHWRKILATEVTCTPLTQIFDAMTLGAKKLQSSDEDDGDNEGLAYVRGSSLKSRCCAYAPFDLQ